MRRNRNPPVRYLTQFCLPCRLLGFCKSRWIYSASSPSEPPHAVGCHLGAVVSVQDVEDVVLGAAAQHGLVQRPGQVLRVPDHYV